MTHPSQQPKEAHIGIRIEQRNGGEQADEIDDRHLATHILPSIWRKVELNQIVKDEKDGQHPFLRHDPLRIGPVRLKKQIMKIAKSKSGRNQIDQIDQSSRI